MSLFLNPANPRYRRATVLMTYVSCTFIGVHIVLSDFGTQEHIFSPVQRFLIPKIDSLFGVDEKICKEIVTAYRLTLDSQQKK